ncbi:MAG TPA: hypothetical protein VLE72_01990 [Candidatus Saccharimonadales bacterium]|nr:hypothetical protein [Candidatus Saccharimonadales bacterium]
MAEVAITVGPVTTPEEYATRIKRIEVFVRRFHVDISDGVFTPTKTIDLAQVYDVPDVPTDLHLMVTSPAQFLETVISLGPELVICHAEAAANWSELLSQWREVGIKVGLALREDTPVGKISQLLDQLDHVLVFTGDHLGFNHSHFKPDTLTKIKQLKQLRSELEIGVDGGMNPEHTQAAVAAGADVINTGGYVVDATEPKQAYAAIVTAAAEASSDDQAA